MCKVIFIFLIISLKTHAGEYLDVSILHESLNAIYTTTREFEGQTKRNTLSIFYSNDSESKKKLSYWLNLRTTKMDFSNYFIRNSKGDFFNYPEESPLFHDLGAGVNGYFNKTLSFDVALNSSIGRYDFAQRSLNFTLSKYLRRDTTIISLQAGLSSYRNPISFYSDPADFKIKQFPTLIDDKSFSLSWDQVISNKLKSQITYRRRTNNKLSPSRNSFALKMAYALNFSNFIKFSAFTASEARGQEFNSPFGVFRNNSFSLEYTWEPALELLISASYKLDLEEEDNFKNNTITLRSFDQYGIGIQYTIDQYTPYLKSSLTKSNFDDTNFQLIGGVRWDF